MRGYCDVMLGAPKMGYQAKVTASLATDLISVTSKQFSEFKAAQVARQLHAEITSSRTK
ncbi:MAG TPA: hypothetical protein VIH91_08535 [Terriglobales bacterium]